MSELTRTDAIVVEAVRTLGWATVADVSSYVRLPLGSTRRHLERLERLGVVEALETGARRFRIREA